MPPFSFILQSMLSLYRKYRPETFDEVIGQDVIVSTLKNQVASGRVFHAYLFTGSRGTGKTSCAKILARAVNCEKPSAGSPCGKCAACKSLSLSGNIDIIELDAASNNGVAEIRSLTESAVYTPVHGKYKVYIVDEVHMLSASAFNALLKTLEEPPAHVIFILATTEPHKLPATILSRCMRFDFRLIPADLIAARIKTAYTEEKIAFEDAAVAFIAAAGEGSMRDALSIADRCAAAGGTVTYALAAEILGKAGRETVRALLAAIDTNNVPAALKLIAETVASGRNMQLVSNELTAYARDLLVLKSSDGDSLNEPAESLALMKEDAEHYSADFLCAVVSHFSSIDQDLRYAFNVRLTFEAAVIRACKLLGVDLSSVLLRLDRLEARPIAAAEPSAPVKQQPAPAQAGAGRPDDALSIWGRITTYFRRNNEVSLYYLAGRQKQLSIEQGKLIVYASGEDFLQLSDENTKLQIDRANASDGSAYPIVIKKVEGSEPDMDAEIRRMQRLAGVDKVNIRK